MQSGRDTMRTSGKSSQRRMNSGPSRRGVLGIAGMVAASAFAKPSIAQGTRDKTLRFVPVVNLASLDPVTPASSSAIHSRAVFDTLYGIDNQLKPRPQTIE